MQIKEGKDINRLYASGNYAQIRILLSKIMFSLNDEIAVSLLDSNKSVSCLELSFLSSEGFPTEKFLNITHEVNDVSGLYICVKSDEAKCNHNKQYIFKDGKWNFDNQNKSAIQCFDNIGTIYTTGAYIMPFSYTGRGGSKRFAWMVTGFEADTFCNGDYIDVNDHGKFLEELTPPADQEERQTEYIIQSLQANGLHRIELGVYKLRMQEESTALYIRKLETITQAGEIKQIESTLDKYLEDSQDFTPTTREILVEAFGGDRTDIFLTLDNALIIGSCRANIWSVTEHRDKHPQEDNPEDKTIWYCPECGSQNVELKQWVLPNDMDSPAGNENLDRSDKWCRNCEEHTELEACKESEYPAILEMIEGRKKQQPKSDSDLPPRQRIQQMLLNSVTTHIELEEHFATSNGYITGVGTGGFDYSHGEVGHYENLEDDTLEDLASAVEMQIEANQKTSDKSQGV